MYYIALVFHISPPMRGSQNVGVSNTWAPQSSSLQAGLTVEERPDSLVKSFTEDDLHVDHAIVTCSYSKDTLQTLMRGS